MPPLTTFAIVLIFVAVVWTHNSKKSRGALPETTSSHMKPGPAPKRLTDQERAAALKNAVGEWQRERALEAAKDSGACRRDHD